MGLFSLSFQQEEKGPNVRATVALTLKGLRAEGFCGQRIKPIFLPELANSRAEKKKSAGRARRDRVAQADLKLPKDVTKDVLELLIYLPGPLNAEITDGHHDAQFMGSWY